MRFPDFVYPVLLLKKTTEVKRGYLLVLAIIYSSVVFGQHGNVRGKLLTSDDKAARD
jgi:hypothetical protein